MFRLCVIVLLSFALSGCSILRAPLSMVEERLQRNDDVYNRYGMDLDLVNVGDSRKTVHYLWGNPRNTQPTYNDFDVYLGIRNSDGQWRVLPGDYNDLKRTTPLIVQVTYVDDFVNAIFLFGQDAFGNSRSWCDDANLCAELFPYHASTNEANPANPLIVSVREPGFPSTLQPGDAACELTVFASASEPDWSKSLNFAELVVDGERLGFVSNTTYHVSRHVPRELDLRVWPNFQYSGDIRQDARDSWQNTLAVDCRPGTRHFVEIGPEQTGLFTLDPGLRVSELDESAALRVLSVKRAIVASSNRPGSAGTRSQPGTANPTP